MNFCTFADQMENCSILINRMKDWTIRFQKNECICFVMTSNPRNNRRNDRNKFLVTLKQAIPTKWDKSCDLMGQNQQNSCVRYFSCCVNVTGFLWTIFLKFNQSLDLKIICITKTFRRQFCSCITLSVILVTK